MEIPKYPIGFEECNRSKRVSEEELDQRINVEIQNMIEFMVKNNTVNHSKAFEDVLIIIDRIYEDEQYYFEVSVAKQHSRGIVQYN
ncbi:hypothetical protein [Bacillus taeanensis]|uniref:Uncharacterized protein n=1 Tax=Bacillus taeanensis TaxID=273032 RepID=A0A366XP16_9BACI|nr:hypothetical protein [Bacillus taeanensis]RBW67476.1 hypothetical protein DS031_21980 [Bacillus taeanensis]